MEESSPINKSASDSEISNYSSLFSSNQVILVLFILFLSAFVINFSLSLLSVYYIIILDMPDMISGILISLLCCQCLFMFVPGYLSQLIGMKGLYLLTHFVVLFMLLLLIFIKTTIFQVIIITFLYSMYPAIAYACAPADLMEKTDFNTRSLAFSFSNAAYSISAMVLGLEYEILVYFKDTSTYTFSVIFISCACATIIGIIFIFLFYENSQVIQRSKPKTSLSQLLNFKRFWKTFTSLMICGISIGMSFAPGYILPIYMDRELGSSQGYGIIIACYFLLLSFFSVALNLVVNYFSLFNTLIVGSFIVALGPLVFLIGNNFYMISIYIFIVSAGASILGARHTEYIGSSSIKGLEIYYYGLLSPSYSFSSLCIGIVAGFTLDEFCPDDGERRCWIMWLIISLGAAVPGILLFVFRPWIDVRRDLEEHDPYVFGDHDN